MRNSIISLIFLACCYTSKARQTNRCEFTYEDPQSTMNWENTKKPSFGLELIPLLAAQLEGRTSLSFINGLTAKIVF